MTPVPDTWVAARSDLSDLSLAPDEVHVWRAALGQPTERSLKLWPLLSSDEQERASRFRFQQHRNDFVVARGLLRRILSSYLRTEARRLKFTCGPQGKPALAPDAGVAKLRFNLSHSHQLVLFALTLGREVGIDLEHIRPEFADLEAAVRFFSPREIAQLTALPANQQTAAFYNCWTRKEAYIKARGGGLSLPLDQFDVSLAPGEPARLLGVLNDAREAARWTLMDLQPAPGYAAALAVEGQGWRLRRWQSPPPDDLKAG
jgi:4'-phosphopantetheinyl transferase